MIKATLTTVHDRPLIRPVQPCVIHQGRVYALSMEETIDYVGIGRDLRYAKVGIAMGQPWAQVELTIAEWTIEEDEDVCQDIESMIGVEG